MIADTMFNKCVDRAISTMRMALGYEEGIPDDWPIVVDATHPGKEEIIAALPFAFPDREVIVWSTEEDWEAANVNAPNVSYNGTDVVCDWNDYLVAFAYGSDDDGRGHMVVGYPKVYGDTKLVLVVAVRI
jgi:hypothetical protein